MKKAIAWHIVAITVILTLTILKYPALQPLFSALCGLFLLFVLAFFLLVGGISFARGYAETKPAAPEPNCQDCDSDTDGECMEVSG